MKKTTQRLLEVFRLRKRFTSHSNGRRDIAESMRWHRNDGYKKWIRDTELASLNFRQYKVDKLNAGTDCVA